MKLLITLAPLFLLLSCAGTGPYPYKDDILDNNYTIIDEVPYSTMETAELIIHSRFTEQTEELLIFEVEITNISDNPLEIETEDFSLGKEISPYEPPLFHTPIPYHALNAYVDTLIEKEIRREMYSESNKTTVTALLGTVLIAGTVVSAISDIHNGSDTCDSNSNEDNLLQQFAKLERPYEPSQKLVDRIKLEEFIENSYLHKTTISPGETIGGHLFFNAKPKGRSCHLYNSTNLNAKQKPIQLVTIYLETNPVFDDQDDDYYEFP